MTPYVESLEQIREKAMKETKPLPGSVAESNARRYALVCRFAGGPAYYYQGQRQWTQDKAQAATCLSEFEWDHWANLDGIDMTGVTVENIT